MNKEKWVTDEDLTEEMNDGVNNQPEIIYQRNSDTGAIREVVRYTDGSQDMTYFADESNLYNRVQSRFEHFAPDGTLTENVLFQEIDGMVIPTWTWGFNEVGVYETFAELDKKKAAISRTFSFVNGELVHILKTKDVQRELSTLDLFVTQVSAVEVSQLKLSEISLEPSVDDPNMIKVLKTRYHNIGNQLNSSVTYAGEFDARHLSQEVMLTPVSGARYNQKGEPIAVDVSDFESISFDPKKEAVRPPRNMEVYQEKRNRRDQQKGK